MQLAYLIQYFSNIDYNNIRMEGSVFLSAVICYILLILMPLKINSIYLSSGLAQFYNTLTINGTVSQSYYSYQINPIVAPYNNSVSVINQNIVISLASFTYDGTSNITCIQGSISTTSFLLNCSKSATSVSYLIFNHAADVFIQKNFFEFNSSDINAGFYEYDLQSSFQKNLPLQKYKPKSQLNAYGFLSSIQIYQSGVKYPISFVSVTTINPAKSGNISLTNMYPYFRLSFSSDIKCVSIFYMIVLQKVMPFFWNFSNILISSIQTTNTQQFGRYIGIKQISFLNNNLMIGAAYDLLNGNYLEYNIFDFTINPMNRINQTNSASSTVGLTILNQSVNLPYSISSSLQVTLLSLQSINITYCNFFSISNQTCKHPCNSSIEIMINLTFNGLLYIYCVPILSSNNTTNINLNSSNYTNSVNQTPIITIIGCKQVGIKTTNDSTTLTTVPQYYCKICDTGYILVLIQGKLNPSCICEPGFYMASSGDCYSCQYNQVKCEFLSTIEATLINEPNQQQYIQIILYLTEIYSYMQNISGLFTPIVQINSISYTPQIGTFNWKDNNTLLLNLNNYPMSAQYQIRVNFQNNFNSSINQYILVDYQQTQQIYFSKAQTSAFTITRPMVSQVIVQNLQPYINTVNSSASILVLISPFLGDKLSIFSLLQTNSLIYCLNFLKVSNQSQFQYSNLLNTINSMFVFQTQPMFKLFGDNNLIDIPNLTFSENQTLSQFQPQSIKKLKQSHTFFQQSINQIVFLFIQIAFIEVLIFLLSFKLCFLIKKISSQTSKSQKYQSKKQQKTTYNTQLKQEDSMKVICLQQSTQNNFFNDKNQEDTQKQKHSQEEQKNQNFLLKYKFSYYNQLQNWAIKWLQKVHLDEQLASLKHTMVFYSYQLNNKKYVFYSSYIISQLISQFTFAYYQFVSSVDNFSMAFQLFYTSFIVFLLIIYPAFLANYDALSLLKIVQIIYKFNGKKNIKKQQISQKIITFNYKQKTSQQDQTQKLYKHSQIFSYFLVVYFQNLFFGLAILLGKNIVYQTFPIVLMFAAKLVYMWKRIKIIDLIKTILLLTLFIILSLSSLTQIQFCNQQIQEFMIYMIISIALLEYFKIFKLILIGFIGFLKKKIGSIFLKHSKKNSKKDSDKILNEQPRIERAHEKLQKIKQLRTLKQSLNQQLYILRKANTKRRNDHLTKQLQVITSGQQSKLKKPQVFDGLEEIFQYNPNNPNSINNNSIKIECDQNIKKTEIKGMVQKIFQKK